MDSQEELKSAVREGRFEEVKQRLSTLNTQQLYILLCIAIESRHKEITQLIINSKYDVLYEEDFQSYQYLSHMAVENNDIKLLKNLLVGATHINVTDRFLCTPLHLAVSNGNKDVIKILLEHESDIDAKDLLKSTALEYAIIEGRTEIVDMLINANADVPYSGIPLAESLIKQLADISFAVEGLTCFHIAAQRGYLKIVHRLIQCGVSVNSASTAKWYKGYTALHFACTKQRKEIVQLLLNNGANVNASSESGVTPLQIAAGKDNETIVKILLDYGANVDAQDVNGKSVLRAAAEKGYSTTVECILKYCPDVNNESNRSSLITALHGFGKKYTPVVHNLVSYGFTIRPEELKDPLLLSAAIEKDCVKLVQKFLTCNTKNFSSIDTNSSIGADSYTLLHFACENGGGEVVNFLLQNGADVNALTKDTLSPLYIATRAGNEKAVKELLDYGANVDDQDKDGKTVLYLAAHKGYLLIVDHILTHCPSINNDYNRKALRAAILSVTSSYEFLKKYESNVYVIEHFFRRGFTIGVEDLKDTEILKAAIMKGYVNVVEYFLKAGSKVNILSNLIPSNYCTLLHFAAENKQKDVVILLIKYGADINARDSTGKSPLLYAVWNTVQLAQEIERIYRYTELEIDFNLFSEIVDEECRKCGEIIEILLQFGVDINFSDNNGRTALHLLASDRTLLYDNKLNAVAELLLKKGADINARDKNNTTPLYISVESDNQSLSQLLLKHGAVINFNYKEDISIIHNAIYFNYNIKFVKCLLKFGANVNSVSEYINSGNSLINTPLHIASGKGYKQLVETLLDCGADVNIVKEDSETALGCAMNGAWLYHIRDINKNHLCEDVFHLLRQHIVRLKCANLYVNKYDLEYLTYKPSDYMGSYDDDIDVEIIDFQGKCKREIEAMKGEIVGNSKISLYDFLSLSTAKLMVLFRNKYILKAISTDSYAIKFPIYSRMISSCITRVKEKMELLKKGIGFFHIYFNSAPRLPDSCVEIILSYLTEQDLKVLVANTVDLEDILKCL